MAKSPNVYDKTYVNSGPGVALSNRSSSSSSGYSSSTNSTSPGVGYVQPRTQEQMAREYANAIKTSPSVLAEKIREEIRILVVLLWVQAHIMILFRSMV